MSKSKAKRRHVRKQIRREVEKRKAQRQPDWIVFGMALFGVLITTWLTIAASTTAGMPLCAEDSACDIIQASRWSTVFGIPVALLGLLTYGLIAFISFEMRPSTKRWRRQWLLALIGVSVSVYLTLIGLIELQTVCAWCLASLATISGIFVWLTIQRPAAGPGQPWKDWLVNSGGLTIAILAVMQLHYSGLLGPGMGREDPQLQALAEHLSEQDARFYGAYWCPACQDQEDLFGRSGDRLPYVECHPRGRGGLMASACVEANISSFPTWIIEGERIEGVQTPEELARLSGFDWEE